MKKNISDEKIFRYLRSQSANQAMWQLQLKGLEMRLRLVKLVSSSNAPGVTQLIMFPYRERLWRLFRPLNRALLTLEILFSDRRLKNTKIRYRPDLSPFRIVFSLLAYLYCSYFYGLIGPLLPGEISD